MSTSLYVHIPFCTRRCPYCSFYHVKASGERERAYLPVLTREIEARLGALPAGTRLSSVYFGGGTPSVLTGRSWTLLFDVLQPYLGAPDETEITCELNPEDVTETLADFLAERGINRVSLGLQSMDEQSQRVLERCPPGANRAAVECVLPRFANVSFDLLLGVPGRGEAALHRTFEELARYGPAHFSVYCLEPGGDLETRSERFWSRIDPEGATAEYLWVAGFLRARGYDHYEVSSYARPGYECRHNLSYWNGSDYLGVGPAAHSFVGGQRFFNEASLSCYLSANGVGSGLPDHRSPADIETERVMLGLRTAAGLEIESLRCPDGVLDGILEEGLARIDGGRIRLTDRGYLVMNEVALRLLLR